LTALEAKLYLALQGARTIVAAVANVNPQALKIKRLIDDAIEAYTKAEGTRSGPDDGPDEDEEDEGEEAANAY
jgi:hypothetical protein